MVEFIKNSTNFGLFILEQAAGNDNTWIADGGIKEADWDLYTEGTDGIYLPYSGRIKHTPKFIIDVIDFFDGEGADISMAEGHDIIILEGRYGGSNETDRNTKMANLLRLMMKHLKTGTEWLYLGYRKIGEIWEPFINASGVIIYYLRGKLRIEYKRAEDQLYYNWKVIFRGVL